MSDIKEPDIQYFNRLLQTDYETHQLEYIDLDPLASHSKYSRRYYLGKDRRFAWRRTNHKDVRLNQLISERHPDIVVEIADSEVTGSPSKVNDSNPGWILYPDLGGNNFIEGSFVENILETLIVIHGHYSHMRDQLKFVPEYRPKLLGQAVRCHVLPPLKYLIQHYPQDTALLKALWSDIETIVYNYGCITDVFAKGDLTLVHGAISSDNVFIDGKGQCKLLDWAEAHWATPYIDLCRLLALGFELEHLFQYTERLQKRLGRRIDEQDFAFRINISIVHVLMERVSWRVRELKAIQPQQIQEERNLQAELDLIYRLLSQAISIFKGLQSEALELGYETWNNIKLSTS